MWCILYISTYKYSQSQITGKSFINSLVQILLVFRSQLLYFLFSNIFISSLCSTNSKLNWINWKARGAGRYYFDYSHQTTASKDCTSTFSLLGSKPHHCPCCTELFALQLLFRKFFLSRQIQNLWGKTRKNVHWLLIKMFLVIWPRELFIRRRSTRIYECILLCFV